MHTLDIVVFGEAMAMFIADDPVPLAEANHYTRAVAGAEVNVAVGSCVSATVSGGSVGLATIRWEQYPLNQIRQAGADTTRVLLDKEHPKEDSS